MELRFYVPGEGRPVVLGENRVRDVCVDVFGVDEEAVHVEDAGADRGEAGGF